MGARAVLVALGLALAVPGHAIAPPVPWKFGHIELDNFSSRAGVPPVAFNHWTHRAKFTCRLCHVDVGFAMTAGETRVSATTNRQHFHCGACHDGVTRHFGEPLFAACSDAKRIEHGSACERCHARRDPEKLQKDYEAFARRLPRERWGGIDWQKAEEDRVIRPVDFVEGVSIRRKPLSMNRDVTVQSKGWMADVIFSHKKHAAWNGCEVCHPDIYPRTRAGEARATMLQISSGESCGVCHDKVAFPIFQCERCHSSPVQGGPALPR